MRQRSFRTPSLWAAITIIASGAAVYGATNTGIITNNSAPRVPPEIKAARVFEDYTLADMKRVFFESSRCELRAADAAALGHMLKQLRANNQSVIELRGYSDGAESVEQGLTLGSLRAQIIASYFAHHGVPADRIRAMAFQEIEDVGAVSNQERRRVDVRVFVPPVNERR